MSRFVLLGAFLGGAAALRPVLFTADVAQTPAVSRRALLAGVVSAALVAPARYVSAAVRHYSTAPHGGIQRSSSSRFPSAGSRGP